MCGLLPGRYIWLRRRSWLVVRCRLVMGDGRRSGNLSDRSGGRVRLRCVVSGCQRGRRGERCRLGTVAGSELRPIRRSLTSVLNLLNNRRRARIPDDRQFPGARPDIDSTATSVVADAILAVIPDLVIVYIVNGRRVYIRDYPVVPQVAAVPIGSVIPVAGVSVSVIDAAVEADMRTPVARMQHVNIVIITPPRRRPEGAHPRGHHPCAGNPVVPGTRIIPIARRPLVILSRTGRLTVLGKRRRRLRSLCHRLIVGRLLLGWICARSRWCLIGGLRRGCLSGVRIGGSKIPVGRIAGGIARVLRLALAVARRQSCNSQSTRENKRASCWRHRANTKGRKSTSSATCILSSSNRPSLQTRKRR